MEPTEFTKTTDTQLKRIAWLSSQNPRKEFHQLMHHFTQESLESCFYELDGGKALGIDKISKSQYGEQLTENLKILVSKLKSMAYRPGMIRQVLIPKEGKAGATRPLGISNFEDKIIQKMTHKVLESIYEPLFLNVSFGFRLGKGCHDAIRALHQYLFTNEVETVIDIDLANYFGSIDHRELEAILRNKIKDKRFMRYIVRTLKAGVLTPNELSVSEEGVPQGSMCSPILANVFAHYVIDQWFEETVKQHCHGKVELFRYCDDMVVCCRYQRDAERVKQALENRLAKYKLQLNKEKTCSISFSKRKSKLGEKQGTFAFLGFTFYLGYSRQGIIIPKLRTNGRRLRSKLKRVNQWMKSIRNEIPLKQLWKIFCAKVGGHARYYGVSHNIDGVHQFQDKAKWIAFKWLNRRSQKRSFNWNQYERFLKLNPLPPVKIYHRLF